MKNSIGKRCNTCDKLLSRPDANYCHAHSGPAISAGKLGKKRPDMLGNKLRENTRAWNKGLSGVHTHSDETKKKMSESHSGPRNFRWITDRTKLAKRQERNDSAYKEWRKSVRDRDGWKCKITNGDCLGKVVAHHILPWSKFPELRYEVNNGITLCQFHHPRKREDEMKLSPYFQSLVTSNSN